MIVSFSGIDSAGKTTQIKLLYKYCKDNNIDVKKKWSKARGTPGVVFLKELVRKDKKMNLDERTIHREEVFNNPKKQRLLYMASMIDLLWYWGIYYRVLGGLTTILICDRYLWDTYVEIKQDFRDVDVDRSILWKLVKIVAPTPKFSFVFMVPAEVSLERDKLKNAAGIDSIERKVNKIKLYEKCVKDNCWDYIMDGTRSINDLHDEVRRVIWNEG